MSGLPGSAFRVGFGGSCGKGWADVEVHLYQMIGIYRIKLGAGL